MEFLRVYVRQLRKKLEAGPERPEYLLTEPGVGTDAANLTSTARREGDVYVLNGSKTWIRLADLADHFLVFASVDRTKKHRGITAFVVERGMKGLSTGTLHGKLGIRAGNTGLINLDNVEVPVENRIGEEGEGFLVAMSAIDQGRYTVAAGAVGHSGRGRGRLHHAVLLEPALGIDCGPAAVAGHGDCLSSSACSTRPRGRLA